MASHHMLDTDCMTLSNPNACIQRNRPTTVAKSGSRPIMLTILQEIGFGVTRAEPR